MRWEGEGEEAGTIRGRRSKQEGGGDRGRLKGGAEPGGFTCKDGRQETEVEEELQ